MSPSIWFCGIRVEKPVFAQAVVVGTVTCRLQRPATTTNGILVPTGTLVRVNVPSTAVVVPTSGEPEGGVPGTGQLTPGVNGATAAFGMYTKAFGSGSTPFGVYTVPLMLVVPPFGQLTCCRHNPVQLCPNAAVANANDTENKTSLAIERMRASQKRYTTEAIPRS
jgi:hypothetical protein